ncbi:MAG: phosphoribosyltransferase [Clostridia bacterium]
MERHKKLSNKAFEFYIEQLTNKLNQFIKKNKIQIDYVCPILRSGAIPAVYIANKLNIIKFAPIQIKHIEYKDGTSGYTKLFEPFNELKITKKNPVFLIVDGTCASGESSRMCIDAFKAKYKKCKIIYICIAKQFNSQTFEKSTIYEDYAFYYNGINNFSKNKCKELGISYYIPLYPWEILEQEKNHPDDLENNIYF